MIYLEKCQIFRLKVASKNVILQLNIVFLYFEKYLLLLKSLKIEPHYFIDTFNWILREILRIKVLKFVKIITHNVLDDLIAFIHAFTDLSRKVFI
jgi:hypothetical protein